MFFLECFKGETYLITARHMLKYKEDKDVEEVLFCFLHTNEVTTGLGGFVLSVSKSQRYKCISSHVTC